MMTNYLMAELSNEAYQRATIESDNAAVLVERDGDDAYIAFRGSDSLGDWADNLWAIPWRPKSLDAWVHRGFWIHLSEVLCPLILHAGSRRLHIAGHSLGGAVANLFAAHCVQLGLPVHSLTTFGSPMPGYDSLSLITRWIPGKRFVIDGDQVAGLPPSWFAFPYQHDRPATYLPGVPGIIDHPMPHYLTRLSL